eukprot:TRINITY_DN7720_c0_g2_i1.p1 TRINITY_DN7720_c0_g2~~TRINITY_DN7720_c0_g2_i1.p1  ORF type:complete len:345 (+),score=112.29 TRINITY_DN7720_c0_g2_i1:42-1037(+)
MAAPAGRTRLRVRRDENGACMPRRAPLPPPGGKAPIPKLTDIGQLDLGTQIGQTHLSDVYKATVRETGQVVAVKRLCKRRLEAIENSSQQALVARSWRTEVRAHRGFEHPYIVKLHDVLETHEYTYLVLEFCPKGDMLNYLHGHLGKLSEEFVTFYTKQVAFALYYLHKHKPGYIHRDLKLENCLIDADRNVQLGDFGSIGTLLRPNDRRATICGTLDYWAPEMVQNACKGQKGVSDKADVWALGVMTYEMLVGNAPFAFAAEIYEAIGSAKIELPEHLTPECRQFLSSVLDRDEKKRLDIEQVCSHPWLIKHHPNFGDAPYLPTDRPYHP